MDEGAEAAIQNPRAASLHIKKRSLRNKSLSISFDDKDLKDYVTGFHKRKKKRRKEAERHLQEKDRRKRFEERKKRKLERALVYGGPLPAEEAQIMDLGGGCGSRPEGDDLEQNTSVSGTKMYDNGNTTITVTTSELSHEDEAFQASTFIPRLAGESEKKISLPVKRKPLKKVIKQKSRRKPKKSAAAQKKGKTNKSKNKRQFRNGLRACA